ncbi:hypothetical protein NDU88_007195 [Pleurodeles waltl]|uniref:Uncharacterized protein n=1 Tax=Pleurodeles waltl TaxID=8319 RepID=A0AAV7MEH8_PLEWA|nr:hypothetical protein NDU88_007195 [Pleurodeles waltl]
MWWGFLPLPPTWEGDVPVRTGRLSPAPDVQQASPGRSRPLSPLSAAAPILGAPARRPPASNRSQGLREVLSPHRELAPALRRQDSSFRIRLRSEAVRAAAGPGPAPDHLTTPAPGSSRGVGPQVWEPADPVQVHSSGLRQGPATPQQVPGGPHRSADICCPCDWQDMDG